MKRLLVFSILAALTIGEASAAPLHLAFGIDGRDDDGSGSNRFENFITLRDHHIDHYHVYFGNGGTDPGGHIPVPVDVLPGGVDYGEVTLASMNVSPDSEPIYHIPSTPEGDFHLELIATAPELSVAIEHEGAVTPLSPGSDAHLSVTDYHTLRFSLAEGTTQGHYDANFRIVDNNGNYYSSVDITSSFTFTNDFYIRVNAVPEPGSIGLLVLTVPAAFMIRRSRNLL